MIGWYELPKSGRPYHGPIPEGAKVLSGPGDAAASSGGPAAPAASASKAAWVEYAVAVGWAPEDAQRKTKKELASELGSEGGEQGVDTSESGSTVGAEVAGDQLGPDPLQLDTVPPDVDGEQTDDDIGTHEA